MASPGESRGSDNGGLTPARAALFAALCVAASFDAAAHGGAGLEWLAVPFLCAVAGFFACFAVALLVGRQPFAVRFLQAIGWTAADIAGSLGLSWLVAFGVSKAQRSLSDDGLVTVAVVFALLPWVLPVILLIRAHRRGP